MKPTLVSVVIPAYNAERFIERTLRSALRQTISNLEFIVVDDGSTDKTKSIVEAIARSEERIRVFSVPNAGVAMARNIGLAHASGEYVAFLDADDLWHPSKIELQIAALNALPHAVASYGMFRNIDELDRVIENQIPSGLSGYALAHHLYVRPVGTGSSLLVRRDIALELGGYESSWAARGIGGCEDYDFELKLVAKYPIVFIPQYLVGYRVYPGNMSSNHFQMGRGLLATLEHHIRLHPTLPNWLIRKARAPALEYAASRFVSSKHLKHFLLAWFQLLRADARRGMKVMFTVLLRLWRFARKVSIQRKAGPHFDDFESDSGVCDYTPSARERRLLERIKHLDRNLARMVVADPTRSVTGQCLPSLRFQELRTPKP